MKKIKPENISLIPHKYCVIVSEEKVWVCKKCGKSVKSVFPPSSGQYGECPAGGFHNYQPAE